MTEKLPNTHPGKILFEEFMLPYNLSQNHIAKDLGISPRCVNEISHGKRSITADTTIRLSQYFGTSSQFWMGLQDDYKLEEAAAKHTIKVEQFNRKNVEGNF